MYSMSRARVSDAVAAVGVEARNYTDIFVSQFVASRECTLPVTYGRIDRTANMCSATTKVIANTHTCL